MAHHARDDHQRRQTRASRLIVVAAATVGLWLGLTAPAVSPVAPPPVPPAAGSTAA